MLKYDKFCDQILEKVTDVKWLQKTFDHCLDGNFPLTPKIAKALYDNKAVVFHISDPLRILDLKKLIGTKKSLSTFTKMYSYQLNDIRGIQTKGGLLLQLEGNLVFKADSDIMSMPDEQGRRWISAKWIRSAGDFFEKLDNIKDALYDKIPKNLKSTWREDKQLKRSFISDYIKGVEDYVINNIEDLKELIANQSGGSWDEILVNEIKILDVLLVNMENLEFKSKIINKYGSLQNCHDILKTIVKGEIYVTDHRKDATHFVLSRGGNVT